MYQDHKDRPISEIPILNSYVEGLDPWEYWASTYGARRGSLKAKFATRDAGAWGKHLGQSVHDLTVTDENCNTKHGLTVPTEDEDSIGSVLAVDTGPFKSGQMITGRVLSTLNKKKIDKIAVRSVVTCQSSHGVCATCAGLREHGRFPKVGENVGLPASQSFGESLSQTQLSAKHTGGVAGVGSSVSGFKAFDQMIQFPKKFLGGAVLAKHDGRIQTIEQAPSGGWYVTINGEQHYVPADRTLSVKSGQAVEQGDTISDGIASPAEVAAYKGLGHARRQFIKSFYDLAKDSGMPTQRRNVEALARGLLRYVAIDEPIGDNLPGDVVDYNQLRKNWTPPEDSVQMPIQKAIGQYAMAPIGELEIGDRIDSRTAKEMSSQYKDPIWVRKDPPPFKPYVVRALEHVSYSDNWLARMGGSYLKRSVLDAVGRGQKAPIHSTSYIGSYAYGDEFGKNIDKTGQY